MPDRFPFTHLIDLIILPHHLYHRPHHTLHRICIYLPHHILPQLAFTSRCAARRRAPPRRSFARDGPRPPLLLPVSRSHGSTFCAPHARCRVRSPRAAPAPPVLTVFAPCIPRYHVVAPRAVLRVPQLPTLPFAHVLRTDVIVRGLLYGRLFVCRCPRLRTAPPRDVDLVPLFGCWSAPR